MVGMAAGISTTGIVPFVSSFAMFTAGRAFDQLRNSVGYPHLNVKVGATHGGISVGQDGATHQCNEDFALMRTIPGMVVICPSDDVEARAAVKAAYEYKGPVYMRFGRVAVPVINDNPDYKFEIGKGVTLKDGNDLTIYDVDSDNDITRAKDNFLEDILVMDHSGEIITASENGNLSLYWEKNRLETALKGQVRLKFGKKVNEKEITPNFKIPVSELEEFSFTVDAQAKWELILGALIKGKFEENDKGMLKQNAFQKLRFMFVAPPAGIPVYLSLDIDLLYEYLVKGEAQLKATGGVTFGGDFHTGVQYMKGKGWSPIADANFTNTPKSIEIQSFANLDFQASVYPRISLKLYNLAGPFLSVKPYFRDEVRAAFYNEIGSVNKDYYALTEKAYAGIDLQAGILLGFVGLGTEISLDPLTLCEGQIYNMPNKLTLQSPVEGTSIKVKESVDVTFNLTRTILGQEVPSPMGMVVKFEAKDGKLNHTYGITDILGNVKVQWTPLKGGAILKAKVFDENMNVISEATCGPANDIYGTWEITYDSIYNQSLDGGKPWIRVKKYPGESITLNEDFSGVWMIPDDDNDIFSYIYNEDYLIFKYAAYDEEDKYNIEKFVGDSLVLVLKENNDDYFYQKIILKRKEAEDGQI